jgi:hypothetical protein
MSNEDKKVKIMALLSEIYEPMLEFLDLDSDKMLDLKIKVLTDLKNGIPIADIPNFYDILELYPAGMWD